MRNTMPIRSRAQSQDQLRTPTSSQRDSMSTIRLVSAAPTAAGSAPGLGDPFVDTSFSSPSVTVSPPTPLAPKNGSQPPKKRLVPKKSKLGLLVSGKRGKTPTPENNDLSDVVRRVGVNAVTDSVAKSGFEIYVDPTAQSEVSEVLMVKKKKSRAALSALKWGTLAEATNSAPSKDLTRGARLKNEDKEKWWSIGRGRKDSKDMRIIEKENLQTDLRGSPSEALPSRARFHSLGSSVVFSTSKTTERPAQVRSASASESPLQDSDPLKDTSHTPTMSCPDSEEMHEPPLLAPPNTTTGSIAIRAMRSIRSVALLANWTNGRPMEKDTTLSVPLVEKHKQPVDVKKNKKTEKRKSDSGGDQMTLRIPRGSTEAYVAANNNIPPIQASTTRKHGVLGLGFPSGFRFGTVRSSSAGSCSQSSTGFNNTSSFDPRGRSSSTASATSSLKPTAAKSRISSSGSASVKWVEGGLETVKLACRRERVTERREELHKQARPEGAIVNIFPEHSSGLSSTSTSSAPRPTLMTKASSEDVHFALGSESMATPRTQTRVRPASDQMTDKERLRCVGHDPDGILSALDAATNELASLINRLDLEATPGTPRSTLRLSPSFTNLLADSPRLKCSPKKNGSQEDALNTQSFRQQIAPWQVSPPGVPPPVSSSGALVLDPPLARPTAASEVSLESPPLSSAKAKKSAQITPVASVLLSQGARTDVPAKPSSGKFRSLSKKKSVGPNLDSQKEFPLSNTFRKMMSTLSLRANKEIDFGPDRTRKPVSKEAQEDPSLAGTLRGSMSSHKPDQSMDFDGPDLDIPKELQDILTGEDKFTSPSPSRRPPSPGLPPRSPLPIPAVLQTSLAPSDRPMISVPWKDKAHPNDSDESDSSSLDENDTRKSFDFTSELKSLSESAGSHRHSFVEQLENAFRTPAKYDLDAFDHFRSEDVPPVPPIPHHSSRRRPSNEPGDPNAVFSSPVSPLLPSPEIIVSKKPTSAASSHELSNGQLQKSSASHKPSYGQLNHNFKFGGSPMSMELASSSQLTLSDIIPSPAHARSLSMASLQDDFLQQSSVPQPMSAPSSYPSARRRANSDSSSMHGDSRMDAYSLHSRASSQTSFKGLESFDEIRRGFEFVENRPTFYPPPSFNHRRNQMPRDSMISIASVSSYGRVINPGVKDPFDYGYQSRPASCDMSAFVTMSTSVDDTFSFIRRGRRRKRVDSDASSFYFRAPGTSRIPRPLKSQFRDSVISTTSIAPPVSIYNRSFGVHRGIDSGSGVGSGAHGFAGFGLAGGNRSSWAPSHRRELSADSVMSDISARVPRPTLGDKMLDSKHDYCVPLTSITASPAESVPSEDSYQRVRYRGSFDSIMDYERPSYSRDSIMDPTDRRTSSTFDFAFRQDGSHSTHSLDRFRINDDPAVSLFSAEGDSADPKREDDTMISMIGGGRVHRRSVSSFVEGSPIFARVGKRKNAITRGQQRHAVQQCDEVVESLSTAQKIEPLPDGLGEERMMSARQGLFSRDSLEEHCLCADGVDTSSMTEPVFSRPVPASRSRSGTHSSTGSGLDTPSLSSSGETSSVASDSISSIDLSRVNLSLTNMSHPLIMQSRNRIRSKGHGHRRRLSGIQISRSSVYETIEEENHTPVTDGFPDSVKASLSPVIDDGVIIVDPDDTSTAQWDEGGIVALRKYYTLKDEADTTIQESKELWLDTPFSIYAVQSFEPPAHHTGMRALLEHSRKTYGPLSAELRRIRSRTNSRPSPYPQPQRAVKISLSPLTTDPEVATSVAPKVVPKPAPAPAPSASATPIMASQVLQKRTVNRNIAATGVSSLVPGKTAKGDSDSLSQARSGSGVRRSVLGWAKRGVGKENQDKNSSSGAMTAPGENQRLNRPRPRGRPSHARTIGPI